MDADCGFLERRASVRCAGIGPEGSRLRILPGYSAVLHDVSSHGLAIRALCRLAPGRSIELRVEKETGHGAERIALRAAIVWSRIDRLAIDGVEYLAGLQVCNGQRVPVHVLSGSDYSNGEVTDVEFQPKPAPARPSLVAPALVTNQGTTPTGAQT